MVTSLVDVCHPDCGMSSFQENKFRFAFNDGAQFKRLLIILPAMESRRLVVDLVTEEPEPCFDIFLWFSVDLF